jgi:hypothetical protein
MLTISLLAPIGCQAQAQRTANAIGRISLAIATRAAESGRRPAP